MALKLFDFPDFPQMSLRKIPKQQSNVKKFI